MKGAVGREHISRDSEGAGRAILRIVIPQNSLVVLCGVAGCGKSTFAAKHFSKTQIVSSDECRALVCDDPADQEITPLAFELVHFIIEKRLLLQRLTVVDATNLKREDRVPLLRLARSGRSSAVAIVFDTSLDLCMSRNASRRRIVPPEALMKQHALLVETLTAIKREGFDYAFIVSENEQSQVEVRIGAPVRR